MGYDAESCGLSSGNCADYKLAFDSKDSIRNGYDLEGRSVGMQKVIVEDQSVAHILLYTMNSVLAADMEPDRLDHKGNLKGQAILTRLLLQARSDDLNKKVNMTDIELPFSTFRMGGVMWTAVWTRMAICKLCNRLRVSDSKKELHE